MAKINYLNKISVYGAVCLYYNSGLTEFTKLYQLFSNVNCLSAVKIWQQTAVNSFFLFWKQIAWMLQLKLPNILEMFEKQYYRRTKNLVCHVGNLHTNCNFDIFIFPFHHLPQISYPSYILVFTHNTFILIKTICVRYLPLSFFFSLLSLCFYAFKVLFEGYISEKCQVLY